jgi:hypothetical protein
VGGLILDLVGRVPDPGDSVEVDGFRLTALDVRGRRIGRVRIEPTGRPEDDGDGFGVAGQGQGQGVSRDDGEAQARPRADRAGDTSHNGS